MLRPRTLRRWLSTAAAALLVTAMAPAAISSAAPEPKFVDHAMGSQIARHEGTAAAPSRVAMAATASVQGIDVSHWQGTVNWASQWSAGKRFVWIKATEASNYTDPNFSANYTGSYNQGFIRGAYHFAEPNQSSGATQANYFSAHGGGWSGDGRTLPGALDLEYGTSSDCWGLSQASMRTWISDFVTTYHARWTKYPIIYTSTSWWSECVGSYSVSGTDPLWVARYNSTVGTLPYNWSYYTVWQYSDSPMDQDVFNGSAAQLTTFATNHD